MSDTNATVKTPATSDLIVEFLRAKGKAKKQAGTATTQEIADHIGKSVKYAYDRLWWLAKKESRLIMIGSGKTAVWRSVPKARKAKAEAVEATSPAAT
jgi:hypothetical protein